MKKIPFITALVCAAMMSAGVFAEKISGGDLNGDGRINVTDLSKLAAHIKGVKPLGDLSNADINCDGKINVTDISALASYVKGGKSEDTQPPHFVDFSTYLAWAQGTGYNSGSLVAGGADGINGDTYRTLPSQAGYDSGRIVIGDSRSCQIGIYEQHRNKSDTAVFALWGGHYSNYAGQILTSDLRADIRACIEKQIEHCGSSTVYLFSSVNDYDYSNGNNSGNISATIAAAESIRAMTVIKDGVQYSPRVVIVGNVGCDPNNLLFGYIDPNEFNRYMADYNSALQYAAAQSGFDCYVSLEEMAGGSIGFIDDGLHYDERTLQNICSKI